MADIDFIEDSVAQALLANTALVALMGARKVFPVKIPQNTKLPCVVYQRTFSNPHLRLLGYSSEAVTLMVNVFAFKYKEAKQIAGVVRAVMGNSDIDAVFRSDRDLYHDDSASHCVSMEFICNQHGGVCRVPSL